MSEYMLDQGDVRVKDYIPMCTECDRELATKIVMVDFRSAGQENAVGQEMCEECADIISERIREGLPTADAVTESGANADKHYQVGWNDAIESAAKIAKSLWERLDALNTEDAAVLLKLVSDIRALRHKDDQG